jgi:hypothetical protein
MHNLTPISIYKCIIVTLILLLLFPMNLPYREPLDSMCQILCIFSFAQVISNNPSKLKVLRNILLYANFLQ